MNLQQTSSVLSYIWSTHPNAPKYTDEDKMRIVAAYFRILYKYDINDVMIAVDEACRKNPAFIPTAYEIESVCEKCKTIDLERFLPPDYLDIVNEADELRQKCREYEVYTPCRSYRDRLNKLADNYERYVFLKHTALYEKEKRDLEACDLDEQKKYQESESVFTSMKIRLSQLSEMVNQMFSEAYNKAVSFYNKTQENIAKQDLRELGFEQVLKIGA